MKIRFILQNKKTSIYLQWTTRGPASGGVLDLTRLMKFKTGVACSGTPWSGQAVYWKCFISLCSLLPLYKNQKLQSRICYKQNKKWLSTLYKVKLRALYVASSISSPSVTVIIP